MSDKIKTLKQADRDTRALIARTEKKIAEYEKALPKHTGRDREDVEYSIQQMQISLKALRKSLGK